MARWLTDRVVGLIAVVVQTMSARRRDWGDAVLAEVVAVPPHERRLGWALGTLWFVLRHGRAENAITPAMRWTRWICCALGILAVSPWMLVSLQTLRDDAPDATVRSMVLLLATQIIVVAGFGLAWLRLRGGGWVLAGSIVAYGLAAALVAMDNGGSPVLAALVFAVLPATAAMPVLVLDFTPVAGR